MSNNSLVFVNGDGQIFASSLKIAEVFEKRHADVLRTIESQLADLPSEFGQRNFALTSFTDSWNRQQPACSLIYLQQRRI